MNVLDSFADASGGKAWLLSGNWTDNRGSEIQNVLDEIASELRNQYSIGYYPSHDLNDGKWHRIEIRAKDRHYHVRSRKRILRRKIAIRATLKENRAGAGSLLRCPNFEHAGIKPAPTCS